MTERVRAVSHYVELPTDLGDTPIPMKRFQYRPTDEGNSVGELTYYTANQLQPNAIRSVDGSLMVIGIELDDIFTAIEELSQFPDKDKIKIYSHREMVERKKSPIWTPEDSNA